MKKTANYLIIEKKNDVYTISPTPKLQDDMGTACYIKYNKKHKKENVISKNDLILTVEASKAILNTKCPISGKIVECNEQAVINPHLLNSATNQDNWILKLTDVSEQEFLALDDYQCL